MLIGICCVRLTTLPCILPWLITQRDHCGLSSPCLPTTGVKRRTNHFYTAIGFERHSIISINALDVQIIAFGALCNSDLGNGCDQNGYTARRVT